MDNVYKEEIEKCANNLLGEIVTCVYVSVEGKTLLAEIIDKSENAHPVKYL